MNDKNIKDNNIKVGDTVYIIKNDKVICGEVIGRSNDETTERLGICWKIQTETQKLERVYTVYTTKKEALKVLLAEITEKVNDLNKQLEYFKNLKYEVYNEYFNHEELKSYRH